MHPNAGLLIVNADDWGGDSSATDAILAAFESGGITSTTGFVHMPDSRRAAEIALGHGIPVGLHLNLTARHARSRPGPWRRRASAIGRHA